MLEREYVFKSLSWYKHLKGLRDSSYCAEVDVDEQVLEVGIPDVVFRTPLRINLRKEFQEYKIDTKRIVQVCQEVIKFKMTKGASHVISVEPPCDLNRKVGRSMPESVAADYELFADMASGVLEGKPDCKVNNQYSPSTAATIGQTVAPIFNMETDVEEIAEVNEQHVRYLSHLCSVMSLEITAGSVRLNALLDTGASNEFVGSKAFKLMMQKCKECIKSVKMYQKGQYVSCANGAKVFRLCEVLMKWTVQSIKGPVEWDIRFDVLSELALDAIIGMRMFRITEGFLKVNSGKDPEYFIARNPSGIHYPIIPHRNVLLNDVGSEVNGLGDFTSWSKGISNLVYAGRMVETEDKGECVDTKQCYKAVIDSMSKEGDHFEAPTAEVFLEDLRRDLDDGIVRTSCTPKRIEMINRLCKLESLKRKERVQMSNIGKLKSDISTLKQKMQDTADETSRVKASYCEGAPAAQSFESAPAVKKSKSCF